MGKIIAFLCICVCFFLINVQDSNSSELKVKNCKTELKVKKNRSVKSISPSSNLNYQLILTNNSNTRNIYKIDIIELQESCFKGKVSKGNVSLSLSVKLNKSGLLVNLNREITLEAGEKLSFRVEVASLENTPVEKWNCSEVKVTSLTCNELVATTVLKTFVRDPSLR